MEINLPTFDPEFLASMSSIRFPTPEEFKKLEDAQKIGSSKGVNLSIQDVFDNPKMSTQELANLGMIKYWQSQIPSMSVMDAVQNGTAKIQWKPAEYEGGLVTEGGDSSRLLSPASYVITDPKTGASLPVEQNAQNPNVFTFSQYNPVSAGRTSGFLFANPDTGKVAPIADASQQFSYTPGSPGGFIRNTLSDLTGGIKDLAGMIGQNPLLAVAINAIAPGVGSAITAANALESGNVLGALTSAVGVPGVSDIIGPEAASAIKTAGQAVAVEKAIESGNVSPFLVSALAGQATSVQGPSASDIEPGSFEQIAEQFSPSTYGTVDLTQPLSGDYTVNANYELFPPTTQPSIEEMGGAQGIQAPELPEVFTPEGTIDYSLFAPTPTGGEPALQMPETPNLEAMGGGQGLALPVEGGTLTEAGLIPSDYTAPLGDIESFINQPAPTSGVDIEALQKQWAEQAAADKAALEKKLAEQAAAAAKASAAQAAQNKALQQKMAVQSSNQDLLNMLMLAGMSGSQQQQQPIQTPIADVKSFAEQGYGNLFGPQLQFADGGDVQTLIDILRG